MQAPGNDNEMLDPIVLRHMRSALELLADGRRRVPSRLQSQRNASIEAAPAPVTMREATDTAFTLAAIAWGAKGGDAA